jgi:hypothetical protein
MFSTLWSVAPEDSPEDVENCIDQDHAEDVAYGWSVDLHGRPVIVYRNGKRWTRVIT